MRNTKRGFFAVLAAVVALMMAACGGKSTDNATAQKQGEFESMPLYNGVNVSHWLSQSERRGLERDTQVTKVDFDSIAAMGFDFVRLPIDEVQFYDEQMNRDTAAFKLLNNAIQWAIADGLRVIVDLHIVRSHHFNNENGHPNTLFTDPKEQQKVAHIWQDLQKDLSRYSIDSVAYEFMNEPVAPSCEIWNSFVAMMFDTIRATEPNRTIVVGSNLWQIPSTFDSLRVPENDKHIVLSFHFYEPELVTHHCAPWNMTGFYDGAVNYPGLILTDSLAISKFSPEQQKILNSQNTIYNKDTMYAHMKPAIEKAKALNLHLICGEFGAYPKVIDKEIRLRWYNDICSIFREHNIANCHWCYRGDFPIVNADRSANELPAILTKK